MTRPAPWLLRRIPEVVAQPRWCGGLSRAGLAAELRVLESDRAFIVSLIVCHRRGLVDFCRDYVVPVPPPPERSQR